VEKGQTAGAFTLAEARVIATSHSLLEGFLTDTATGKTVEGVDGSLLNTHWDNLITALEKTCRKGALGLNEAAQVHAAAVRLNSSIRVAVSYYNAQKKVEKVEEPVDNIDVRSAEVTNH